MPSDYSLSELTKLADVSARTVRYYIVQGLLPSPIQQGPNTRYTEIHLDRLRLIKRLQNAHLPLAEIRRQLWTLPEQQVASLADNSAAYEAPADSALDYIESVLAPRRAMLESPAPAAAAAATPVAPAASTPAAAAPAAAAPSTAAAPSLPAPIPDADRTQWERIVLDPDVEVHIRRPLTRQHNKQVERLVKIARELLREE